MYVKGGRELQEAGKQKDCDTSLSVGLVPLGGLKGENGNSAKSTTRPRPAYFSEKRTSFVKKVRAAGHCNRGARRVNWIWSNQKTQKQKKAKPDHTKEKEKEKAEEPDETDEDNEGTECTFSLRVWARCESL